MSLLDQFDPDKVGAVPPPGEPPKRRVPGGLLSKFDPYPDEEITGLSEDYEKGQTSFTGALARGAERSALPAIGSLPAIGAGAELGAAGGAFVGGPFGAAVGGVAGGIAGGIGGSYAIGKAQDYALSMLPDSWKDPLGLSERQQQLDEKHFPKASFLGGLVPIAMTMRPGIPKAAANLPQNATALQRILAHPVTHALFGGGVFGGIELGQELAHGDSPDWAKVAMATGFGVVFNRPNRIGERIMGAGAVPARRLLGRPEPITAPPAAPGMQAPPEAPAGAAPGAAPAEPAPAPPSRPDLTATEAQAEILNRDRLGAPRMTPDEAAAYFAGTRSPPQPMPAPAGGPPAPGAQPVTAADMRRELLARDRLGRAYPPTIADAADLGVMGPGTTEQTFLGSHQRSTDAEQSAREQKQLEISVIGHPNEAAPDVHSAARQLHLELFTEWDRLQAQRAEHLRWIDDLQAPDEDAVRQMQARRDALQLETELAEKGGTDTAALKAKLNDAQRQLDALKARREAAAGAESPDLAGARRHLAATEDAIRDITPRIQSALRGAAERLGAETVEHRQPEPPAPEAKPIETQLHDIAAHVSYGLARAGIQKIAADIEGQFVAARYALRARLFPNDGGPEAMYRRESAEILRGREASKQTPSTPRAPRAPRKFDPDKLSLLPFLASGRGIEDTPDLRAIFGGKNPLTPAGPLLRKNGKALDLVVHDGDVEEYLGKDATVRGLMAAINDESRGRKIYRQGQEPPKEAQEGPEWEPLTAEEEAAEAARDAERNRESELMTEEDREALERELGQPIAYHGSQYPIEGELDPEKTRLHRGVFFSETPELANRFAEGSAVDSDPRYFSSDDPEEIKAWVESVIGPKAAERVAGKVDAYQRAAEAYQQQQERVENDANAPKDEWGSHLDPAYVAAKEKFTAAERDLTADLHRVTTIEDGGGTVTKADIDLGRTYEFDFGGRFDWDKERDAIRYARANGYDSVTFSGIGGHKFYAVFRKEQIRRPFPQDREALERELSQKSFLPPPLDRPAPPAWSIEEPPSDRPLAYHGSHIPATELDPEKTILKRGVFFSGTPELANEFAMARYSFFDDMLQLGDHDPEKIKALFHDTLNTAEAQKLGGLIDEYVDLSGKLEKLRPSSSEAMNLRFRSMDIRNEVNDALNDAFVLTQGRPYIRRARLDLGKTYHHDFGGKFDLDKEGEIIDAARKNGYDSVSFTGAGPYGRFYTVFRKEQIGSPFEDRELAQSQRINFADPEHPEHELWKNAVPAIMDTRTGQVIRGRRGQTHKDLMDEHDGVFSRGYWDKANKKFVSWMETELDTTDLMTPAQRRKQGWIDLEQKRRGVFSYRTAGEIAEGQRPTLRITAEGNVSTPAHEYGHQFMFELSRDAKRDDAPQWLKDDWAHALQWMGLKDESELLQKTAAGRLTAAAVRAHEKFARGYEAWRMEGVAPNAALARIFKMFADFLQKLYNGLKGLEADSGMKIDLTDRMREVYGHLFEAPEDMTVIAPEREAARNLGEEHVKDAAAVEPEHADAVKARIDFEDEQDYLSDPNAKGLEDKLARFYAENEPAHEPGGTADGGGSETQEIHTGTEPPGPDAGGGSAGASAGAERGGVNTRGPEGAGLAGGGAASQRSAGEQDERRAHLDDQPLAPGPADSFAGRDTFNVGKKGNIRTENITSVPQFMQALEEAKERIPGTTVPVTLGEMQDAAREFGFEPEDWTLEKLEQSFGGLKDLPKKLLAFRRAIREQIERVGDLTARVDGGEQAAIGDLVKEMTRLDMFASVLSSTSSEWGRTGWALHNLDKWDEVMKEGLATAVKKYTGRDLYQLKMIAKLAAQYDTPAKVAKFMRDAQKRSFMGMAWEYFVNNLISGVSTHVTYTIGNGITTSLEAGPDTILASAIGAARSAAGRQGERVYAGEALQQFRAMGGALPKALQGALEAVKTGRPTMLPGQEQIPGIPFFGETALKLAQNITSDPVTYREFAGDLFAAMKGLRNGLWGGAALIAAGGHAGAPLVGAHWSPLGQIPDVAVRGVPVVPVGSLVRVPGRVISAIHSFFTILNYERLITARAYREGMDKNLTGNALASHIGSVTVNPPEAWMKDAHEQAYNATLMGSGGEFIKRLSALMNWKTTIPGLGETRPLKFIDPFVHIGANVINKAIMERTPLGILSQTIRDDLMGKNGNVAQDYAQARMLMGTAMAIGFGSLAMEGYITGSGPSDRNENAAWREVYQPHSVRIGDMWYQVNRLGPMGMHLGIAADLYSVARDISEGEALEAAAHLQHAITQNILDESFMRGPSELIKALDDPGRYGETYLKNFVASFVPFSVGVYQMNRAADPYTRQARTVMDAIMQRLPGQSVYLQPRVNVWGEDVPSPDAFGHAGFTAIYLKRINEDPVRQAMLDLGVAPAPVPKSIRNVELTPEEYTDFARRAGRMAKLRLDAIVNSPDWRMWPNHIRHDVIAETLKQSREAARGYMMAKYPHIPRDAVEDLRERRLGEPEPIR